jgi:hypothetical protein
MNKIKHGNRATSAVSKRLPLSQYFKPEREMASEGRLVGACLFNYSPPTRADVIAYRYTSDRRSAADGRHPRARDKDSRNLNLVTYLYIRGSQTFQLAYHHM